MRAAPAGYATITSSKPRTAYLVGLMLVLTVVGCTSSDQSFLIYRLPNEANTDVRIWQDHLTHSPPNRIDMAGINGTAPYRVVAAQAGTVRFIEDSNTENCCGGSCDNNYVWIQHLGEEWTKYSHLATGSVTGSGAAGLSVGDAVSAGQYLGDESNIGRACGSNDGRHLHFEVLVPNNPDNPTLSNQSTGEIAGENRIPRFCGVPDQTVVKGEEYSAVACPGT